LFGEGQFEKYRQKHPTAWSAGDHLTIADFVLSEMLMQADLMVPGMLEQYPLLKALVDKFIVSDIWTAQRWRALSRRAAPSLASRCGQTHDAWQCGRGMHHSRWMWLVAMAAAALSGGCFDLGSTNHSR
jgi:hypothetical protein